MANELYNMIQENINKNKKEGKDNKDDIESLQLEIGKENTKKRC